MFRVEKTANSSHHHLDKPVSLKELRQACYLSTNNIDQKKINIIVKKADRSDIHKSSIVNIQ